MEKKPAGTARELRTHIVAHAFWETLRYGVPAMIGWLTERVASIKGLSLYEAILLGLMAIVVVSAVFAIAANQMDALREKRRQRRLHQSHSDSLAPQVTAREQGVTAQCADSWLHQIMEFDRRHIETRVSIGQIRISGIDLTGLPPYVRFELDIYNGSIFDAFIEDKMEGYIKFRDKELDGAIIPRNSYTMDIAHGNYKVFAIEQRLGTLAEFVRTHWDKRDSFFTFHSLKIKIRGTDDSPQVEPKYLRTDKSISSNGTPERIGELIAQCEAKDGSIRVLESKHQSLKRENEELERQTATKRDLTWVRAAHGKDGKPVNGDRMIQIETDPRHPIPDGQVHVAGSMKTQVYKTPKVYQMLSEGKIEECDSPRPGDTVLGGNLLHERGNPNQPLVKK